MRLLGDEEHVRRRRSPARLAELAADDAERARCAANWPAPPNGCRRPTPCRSSSALVAHDEDLQDPYLPLLIWWAVEQHAVAGARSGAGDVHPAGRLEAAAGARRDSRAARAALRRRGDASPAIWPVRGCSTRGERPQRIDRSVAGGARRGAARIALEPSGGSAGTLFANLAVDRQARGNDAADSRLGELPPELVAQVDRAWQRRHDRPGRDSAGGAPRRATAPSSAPSQLAGDSQAARCQAHRSRGNSWPRSADAASIEPLSGMLAAAGEPPAAGAGGARGARPIRRRDEIAAALLAAYPTLDAKLRARRVDVLLGRKAWAARLLAAVDAGEIAAKDVSVDQLRLVVAASRRRARRAGEEALGQHSGRHARGAAGRDAADQQRPAGRPRRPGVRARRCSPSTAAPATGCSARGTRSGPS